LAVAAEEVKQQRWSSTDKQKAVRGPDGLDCGTHDHECRNYLTMFSTIFPMMGSLYLSLL